MGSLPGWFLLRQDLKIKWMRHWFYCYASLFYKSEERKVKMYQSPFSASKLTKIYLFFGHKGPKNGTEIDNSKERSMVLEKSRA